MTEPTAAFKQWMTKHAYDPEHGKEVPTQTAEPAQTPAVPEKPADPK